jgi:hypothetical protein
VARAACQAGGAGAAEVAEWVDRFCAGNRPVPSPTAGRRWSTEPARRIDEDLVRRLASRCGPPGAGSVERERLMGSERPSTSEVVRDLTTGSATLHFLGTSPGRSDLLAQSEILDVCRAVWESAGRTVAVSTPTTEAARRWAVLTGIPAYRPGDRPDVLVIDRADRRTSSELARLLRTGAGTERLVFVEGGTLPRLTNPASHGLAEVAARVGRHAELEHTPWATPSSPASAASEPPAIGRAAAEHLLQRWAAASGAATEPAVLVGLGVEEVRALNRAALGEDRPARGPERFRPRDRVVVLKGGEDLPPYGTFGTVAAAPSLAGSTLGAVGRRRRLAGVEFAWSDGSRSVVSGDRDLARVGFGYAVTPWLARRADGPLMVLGPALVLGLARTRVTAEVDPGRRQLGRVAGRSWGE